MTSRFPLLFGNALALPGSGLKELLFFLELAGPHEELRALSLTFEMQLEAEDAGGEPRLRPVPLVETWPAAAVLEVALEVEEHLDVPGDFRLEVEGGAVRGYPVPGADPPRVVYRLPVPTEWLMPEAPYVLLVHREDLGRLAERCLAGHRARFGPAASRS